MNAPSENECDVITKKSREQSLSKRIVTLAHLPRPPVFGKHALGTPGRTTLSTNGTCQLEKTENSARKWSWVGRGRAGPAPSRSLSRALRKPQHMQNVSDTDAVLRQSDGVNKMGRGVRNSSLGSPAWIRTTIRTTHAECVSCRVLNGLKCRIGPEKPTRNRGRAQRDSAGIGEPPPSRMDSPDHTRIQDRSSLFLPARTVKELKRPASQ